MLRSYLSIRALPLALLMFLSVNAKADNVNYLFGYAQPTLGMLTAPDSLASVQVSFVPSVPTVTNFAPSTNFSMASFFAASDTPVAASFGSFVNFSSPVAMPEVSSFSFSGVPADTSVNFASAPLYTGSFFAPTTRSFANTFVNPSSFVNTAALDLGALAVPETSSWMLAATGLLLIGVLRKRAII